jgi:hypothetical protein
MPKGKILGMSPKVAIAIGLVTFVAVYLWYRNRSASSGIPTQTQTTPQVGPDQTGTGAYTGAPAATTDSTGGVSSLSDTLSTLSGFLSSLPYTSYVYAPSITGSYNTTTTTTYLAGGGGGTPATSTPTPTSDPAPAAPAASTFTPSYYAASPVSSPQGTTPLPIGGSTRKGTTIGGRI